MCILKSNKTNIILKKKQNRNKKRPNVQNSSFKIQVFCKSSLNTTVIKHKNRRAKPHLEDCYRKKNY